MNTFHETEAVYEQMSLILKEINRLSNIYEEWKIYLLKISNNKNIVIPTVAKSDIENLKFIDEKFNKKIRKQNTYSDVATKVASLLKESGTPLSTKQIHSYLTEKCKFSISYSNLSSNILRRIHEDNNISVERAYRGYWQYRQKKVF
ncbi:hypothetical protein [Enterococcus faecalis]|uniref:hypothetical protein n=1 Tax=Enterococcus faecalis TaxID=1351 RepID=UPI00287F6528|nr:hypothetical protein [Enterococcus faecalis]